jgi:hypothetical protein
MENCGGMDCSGGLTTSSIRTDDLDHPNLYSLIMIFAVEYLGDRRLRKPVLMAEQKQYPLLQPLTLDGMRLGPLAIVVDLQLPISVIFISIVLVNHFSD